MKRNNIILIAASVSALALGATAIIVGNKAVVRADADTTLSITWNASTGATARTAKNNPITVGSRYVDEWEFGVDGQFAKTVNQNSFIDNFTEGSHPIQKLVSFTINYTTSGEDGGKIDVSFLTQAAYSYGLRIHVDGPVSGHKYVVGEDAGWDYVTGSQSDTFSYFYIQNETTFSSVAIESFTLEYTCA